MLVTDESGFTLIEIIVAITLTTMLVGFAFGIYLMAQTYFVQWQRRMRAQDQAHVAAQVISDGLFRADHVVKITPHSLILQTHTGKTRVFWLHNHVLMADSTQMFRHLTVTDFYCHAGADSLARDTTLQSHREPDFITFVISIAIQKDTLTLERSVYLREHSFWDPLKQL